MVSPVPGPCPPHLAGLLPISWVPCCRLAVGLLLVAPLALTLWSGPRVLLLACSLSSALIVGRLPLALCRAFMLCSGPALVLAGFLSLVVRVLRRCAPPLLRPSASVGPGPVPGPRPPWRLASACLLWFSVSLLLLSLRPGVPGRVLRRPVRGPRGFVFLLALLSSLCSDLFLFHQCYFYLALLFHAWYSKV